MSSPYLGEIKLFGAAFAPRGYALCNGQVISVAQNTALFSLLGTYYGGDGQVTFALPDLRGRSPVHWGQGPGLQNVGIGEKAGNEAVQLTIGQMPAHNHPVTVTGSINVLNSTGNKRAPGANVLAGDVSGDQMYSDQTPDSTLAAPSFSATATCGVSGANQVVNLRNPYLGVSFAIATAGIYPSRE